MHLHTYNCTVSTSLRPFCIGSSMTYFSQLITNSAKKVFVHMSVSALPVICSELIPRDGIMRSKGPQEFVVLRPTAGFASRELVRRASPQHLWRCCSHRIGPLGTGGGRTRRYAVRWHRLPWWCETENTHSAHLSSLASPQGEEGTPRGTSKPITLPGPSLWLPLLSSLSG